PLPADFPGALFIVIHMEPESASAMAGILSRAGVVPASNAQHGERFEPGRVYVAPSDRHLLLASAGRMLLGRGPKENRFRPAIDPLFRSAALHYGPRTTGIVLTGALDDGTAGLCAIKRMGGLAVVQDPREAEVSSMPASVLRHVAVDHCGGVDAIAALLPKLAAEPVPAAAPIAPTEEITIAVEIAAHERRHEADTHRLGQPSRSPCPECRASVFQTGGPHPPRVRCHSGHAFTVASLEAELRKSSENVSWSTVRALQEHAMLLDAMADETDAVLDSAADLRRRAE